MNYYNDHDRFCAVWLRELIKDGLIPDGEVDERGIEEVRSGDLRGFTQHHFFAGLAGWSYALQLAGWPTDEPVWSASLPCQPFSAAGKRLGQKDERHLWPEFLRLVQECQPQAIIGEQVASAEVVGTELEAAFVVAVQGGDYARANKFAHKLFRSQSLHYWARWIDRIRTDMEAEGYSARFEVLGAHSIGAPHIRQRLFWVADRQSGNGQISVCRRQESIESGRCSGFSGLAESPSEQVGRTGQPRQCADERMDNPASARHITKGQGAEREARNQTRLRGPECGCQAGRMADAKCRRCEGGRQPDRAAISIGENCSENASDGRLADTSSTEFRGIASAGEQSGNQQNPWADSIWLLCRDGKTRRIPAIKSYVQSLFDGLPDLMGNSWNYCLSKIKEEILSHAKKTKTRPREILQTLWCAIAEKAIRHNLGGHGTIREPAILLVALCQLAGDSRTELHFSAYDIASIQERTMRIVWSYGLSSCSSYQQGLERPSSGESTDSLHCLPSQYGASETNQTMQDMRNAVQTSSDVPEALSALEEIWRSYADQDSNARENREFQIGAGIIRAMNCFPLSGFIPGRIGILRGAGNAIVPQIAAEFIKAFRQVA